MSYLLIDDLVEKFDWDIYLQNTNSTPVPEEFFSKVRDL